MAKDTPIVVWEPGQIVNMNVAPPVLIVKITWISHALLIIYVCRLVALIIISV